MVGVLFSLHIFNPSLIFSKEPLAVRKSEKLMMFLNLKRKTNPASPQPSGCLSPAKRAMSSALGKLRKVCPSAPLPEGGGDRAGAPHKDCLTALRMSCLHIFRHPAEKSLDIHQYACGFRAVIHKNLLRDTAVCGYKTGSYLHYTIYSPIMQ